MKNLLFLMLAVAILPGCYKITNRCDNGELSQEECCATDAKYCLADVGGDTSTATDAGTDIDVIEDATVDAEVGCDPACATGVCKLATKTCVACLVKDDCTGSSVCDTATNQCVGCIGNGDCTEPSVCDVPNNTCVGCLDSEDCEAGITVCDVPNKICVGCMEDGDCASEVCDLVTNSCITCREGKGCSGGLVCKTNAADTDTNACVTCLENTSCTTAAAAKCDATTNVCVGCSAKADCSHIADTNQCSNGKCVECTTATEDVDCLIGTDAFACDVMTNECSDNLVKTAGVCQPCVSNSNCFVGYSCVPTKYMGVAAGNYCMLLSTGQTCPAPYGGGLQIRNDITNTEINVCMIKESLTSCEAYSQFGELCNGSDTMCTGAGGVCKQFDAVTRACTYACSIGRDCDDSCAITANGKFCGAIGD